MTFAAKILADSMSPDHVRLTTFEITFPRIVLAEFNTHRVFSRNSASSRAIPVEKMIRMVQENPYVPSSWGKNQKGMQAGEDLSEDVALACNDDWLRARDNAVASAKSLLISGVHKQLTNRLLEPFMWHTVIVTATEWSNFFHLRNNPMAHPDIQRIAEMMQDLYEISVPAPIHHSGWHLPLVTREEHTEAFSQCVREGVLWDVVDVRLYEKSVERLIKISVGRCARVSYLTHDGKRDPDADIKLHDELLKNGHMSPFEHVARPADTQDSIRCMSKITDTVIHGGKAKLKGDVHIELDATLTVPSEHQWHGNLRGWLQYRKAIPHESDILAAK